MEMNRSDIKPGDKIKVKGQEGKFLVVDDRSGAKGVWADLVPCCQITPVNPPTKHWTPTCLFRSAEVLEIIQPKPYKQDEQMREFLKGVQGVCEVDSYSRHMLWEENHWKAEAMDRKKRTWVSDMSGLGETVGFLDNRPVHISLFKSVIDGKTILFSEATSTVVDYDMIRDWYEKNLPATARLKGGRPNVQDADNFTRLLGD